MFFTYINKISGIQATTQKQLLASLAIVVGAWLIRFIILRIIWHRTDNVRKRYMWRKSLTYVVLFISLISIGLIWIEGLRSLTTFFGLLSAGMAIAMRDPIADIAGWFFIIIRRPFVLGDRIEIDKTAGDVVDIHFFQFTLMEIGNWVDADQSTGRVVHIPNGKIFAQNLANYSAGFQYIWNEISVLLTFESDWQKAKSILQSLADQHARSLTHTVQKKIREASRHYMIFYKTLTPIVYTDLKDSGVLLTLRYLCEPRQRRSSRQTFVEAILKEFAEHNDIDFAYPTQRFYDMSRENPGASIRRKPGRQRPNTDK